MAVDHSRTHCTREIPREQMPDAMLGKTDVWGSHQSEATATTGTGGTKVHGNFLRKGHARTMRTPEVKPCRPASRSGSGKAAKRRHTTKPEIRSTNYACSTASPKQKDLLQSQRRLHQQVLLAGEPQQSHYVSQSSVSKRLPQ